MFDVFLTSRFNKNARAEKEEIYRKCRENKKEQ